MDKAERVAEEALQSVSYRVSRAGNRDRVAAILRREYGDVRQETPAIICDTCKWATVNELYEPDCLGQHVPNSDSSCRFYAAKEGT